MINLNRKIGFFSLRVWGLILNFIGNALAIYGAIGFISDGSRFPVLIIGLVLTVSCIVILAKP
ncbi:hypothetical protein DRQ09_02200 [candidate division KSB1 bacterium]|nr:MAG: hypothetical protein DRQ09_02200 [candidate division KSB1 bacterium]